MKTLEMLIVFALWQGCTSKEGKGVLDSSDAGMCNPEDVVIYDDAVARVTCTPDLSQPDGCKWTLDEDGNGGYTIVVNNMSVPAPLVSSEGTIRIYGVDTETTCPERLAYVESVDGGRTFSSKMGVVIYGEERRHVDPTVRLVDDGRSVLCTFADTEYLRDPANTPGKHEVRCALGDGGEFEDIGVVYSQEKLVDPDISVGGSVYFLTAAIGGEEKNLVAISDEDGGTFTYLGYFPYFQYGIGMASQMEDGRLRVYGFSQKTQREVVSFTLSAEDVSRGNYLDWSQDFGVRFAVREGYSITDIHIVESNGEKMIFPRIREEGE